MAIELDTPVVIPPTPQRVYNVAWYNNWNISCPSPLGGGSVKIEVSAMDPATRELAPGGPVKTISLNGGLLEAIASGQLPKCALAMEALINAASELEEYARVIEATPH